ncbi:MAG: UDP-glucose dehydrogenase family protein [Candidatus Hodarchaeales archaeon]|jgi:nucleotide sugar dehydrogenase
MNSYSVAVHGTGFIGLVSGCCFAIKGFKTVNSTFNAKNCEQINQGKSPFFENGLTELLKEAVDSGYFKCVIGREDAVKESDISMIAVGTPMRKDNSIDLQFIEQTARQLGQALRKKDDYHLIVVRSTVVPGTTRNLVGKLIEEESGKEMGKDFGLCMQPEFLAEGRSILDTLEPDRIVIGEFDTRSGDILQQLYEEFYGDHLKNCPILRMNLESAELVKYGNNCLLATKISYANEMSRIAELVPGIDVVQVMKGVGLDYRINGEFLGAGVGFGGSCFPKDVNAITAFAKSHNYNPRLFSAVLGINEDQTTHVVDLLQAEIPDLTDKRVTLLGLSFKPGTDDMRFAPSIRIANNLIDRGATVIGYDPVAEEEAQKVIGDSILYADTIQDALQNADAAIIVTEWDNIASVKPEHFKKFMKTPIVIDGRRVYDPTTYNKVVQLRCIGRKEFS